MSENTVVKVCIPHTNRDFFDYTTNERLLIGSRVWVPFRRQNRLGVVVGIGASENNLTLKPVGEIIDKEALLSEATLNLCQWISRYYQSPLSEVIPLALPKKLREGAPASLPLSDYYQLAMSAVKAHELINKRAVKQHALLDFLKDFSRPIAKKTLTGAGFTTAHCASLEGLQIIKKTQQVDLPDYSSPGGSPPLVLNEEQALAVESIRQHLHAYHCFLLQGVTGSGKTEVYLQVISEVLAREKQVLILVPEIGLTPQLLARFSARFSEPMVVIHSNLNETQRATAWQAANTNRVKLVIGTRSAIFTPLPNLGLIVIDEEHDSSLKQMEGVRYSARDSALMRAHIANIPIILGSATPSLESVHNCNLQKYTLLRLNNKAMKSAPLHYQLIDLRNHTLHEGIASPTLHIINDHLKNGNQVLVFINRRGFAPVLLCHACGFMVDCRACDSHLTMHRQSHRLICHHCGLTQPIPSTCKKCNGKELIPIGSGTQRIYDYLEREFPDTEILRIDRDVVRKKDELNTRLDLINDGQVQLIVGTQMLAKGHHFPRLTLVVVVDADCGFYNQDFRALEQLGQLLTQVAGRAGRAEFPGQVIIQTHLPHHPLLNLLIQEGYDAFAKALLSTREQAALPPYHYLAVIRAQDSQSHKVMQLLQLIKNYLGSHPVQVLGPAPAPLARKANQYRMQLLLKAPTRRALQHTLTVMREWLTMTKQTLGVRWNVDVDPQDLS
ncbi:MAG: primosomal protein N' [Legionella sp.]|nr:primosomal protein N' [Legionella sp.]